MGTLWGRPVATVYIRTSRYTHDFIDANDYFTISFYPEEYKKVPGVLGSIFLSSLDNTRNACYPLCTPIGV